VEKGGEAKERPVCLVLSHPMGRTPKEENDATPEEKKRVLWGNPPLNKKGGRDMPGKTKKKKKKKKKKKPGALTIQESIIWKKGVKMGKRRTPSKNTTI